MAFKMTALRTFDGLEGFKQKGDKLNVVTKNRTQQLFNAGYAKFDGKQGQDENGVIQPTPGERIAAAKTHADLDNLVTEFKLADIPTKDDGATMDERKTAIKAAIQ